MKNKSDFDNHEQLALQWLREAIFCIENGGQITDLRIRMPISSTWQSEKPFPEIKHTGETILTVGYKSSVSKSES